MNYKDPLGNEIKNIFEEDVKDLELSSLTISKIMDSRKVSLKEKIRTLLNKEIEIPLAPAIVGFVLVLGISILPKNLEITGKVQVIEINGSQIIIRDKKEVS